MDVLSNFQGALTSQTLVVLIVPAVFIIYYFYQIALHPLHNVPGPFWAIFSSFPLVLQCRRTRKTKWVQEQHGKYGSLVRIAPNHVSVTDPQAINQVYGQKGGFLKGPFYEAFFMVEPVLFNTRNADIHNRKWKYMNAAFSPRNLQDFEKHMNPSILWLVRFLHTTVTNSKSPDFSIWANFLAFDIMGEWSFGAPFGFLESGCDDYNLIEILDTRSEVLNAMGHLPLWLRPYMKHFRLDPFWYNGLRSVSNLGVIGNAAYQKRRAKSSYSYERKDLMSFLMKAKDPDTGAPLREREIVAEAISFIGGGSHTTSHTMTHFMDFVSRDQKLQSEIWKELCEAFPKPLQDDWVAPEEVTARLPLLNAVLKEVMRLRPTSSTGLERVVPEGGRVVGGVYLPAGCLVSVPTVAIHHNSTIYQNPEKFDPQRWLRPDAKDLTDYFIPFSTGSRACVGRVFALMEITKTLATILRLFRFERTIEGESETREGFIVKITECEVKVSLREKDDLDLQ